MYDAMTAENLSSEMNSDLHRLVSHNMKHSRRDVAFQQVYNAANDTNNIRSNNMSNGERAMQYSADNCTSNSFNETESE